MLCSLGCSEGLGFRVFRGRNILRKETALRSRHCALLAPHHQGLDAGGVLRLKVTEATGAPAAGRARLLGHLLQDEGDVRVLGRRVRKALDHVLQPRAFPPRDKDPAGGDVVAAGLGQAPGGCLASNPDRRGIEKL